VYADTPALCRSCPHSFATLERYCDKYLSRRRATLIRKKSKKNLSIDYPSFSPFDGLLTVPTHDINVTTIIDISKPNNNNNNHSTATRRD
jgi:hypothetical protein